MKNNTVLYLSVLVLLLLATSPAMVLAEAYPEETPISTEEPGGMPGIPNVEFCQINTDGVAEQTAIMTAADFEPYGVADTEGNIISMNPDIGYPGPCLGLWTEVPGSEEPSTETPTQEPTQQPITQEPTVESSTEVPATEAPVTEVPFEEPTELVTEEPTAEATEVLTEESPVTAVPTENAVITEATQTPATTEMAATETTETEDPFISMPTEVSDGTEGGQSAESTASSESELTGGKIAKAALMAANAIFALLDAA